MSIILQIIKRFRCGRCSSKIYSFWFSAVPSAPQSVHIRNMGKDSLTLEWSAPDSDGGSRIKKYIVEQSKAGSDKWTKVSFLLQLLLWLWLELWI